MALLERIPEVCPNCNSTDININQKELILICNNCGNISELLSSMDVI